MALVSYRNPLTASGSKRVHQYLTRSCSSSYCSFGIILTLTTVTTNVVKPRVDVCIHCPEGNQLRAHDSVVSVEAGDLAER